RQELAQSPTIWSYLRSRQPYKTLRSRKRDRPMKTQRHVTPGLAVIALVMVVASPLRAADLALEDFKAEIDTVIGGLASGTNAALEWIGADSAEIRRDSDTLVATITGARLIFRGDEVVRLFLDRLEIRQTEAQEGS